MTIKSLTRVAVLGIVAMTATAASAHITLEHREAKLGGTYKGVLKVPHGCEKSATVSIHVTIPEGVIGVKPMPKPGWTLTAKSGRYAKTYKMFHAETSEGITEITWSGGNLPDAWYDEFVFQGYVAGELEAGRTIYFPVVQECEKGAHGWIEIPGEDKPASDYPSIAPNLKLLPVGDRRH
jgi:uncharacterized protein YcnI